MTPTHNDQGHILIGDLELEVEEAIELALGVLDLAGKLEDSGSKSKAKATPRGDQSKEAGLGRTKAPRTQILDSYSPYTDPDCALYDSRRPPYKGIAHNSPDDPLRVPLDFSTFIPSPRGP